ncbi:MAG: hypothetical protein JSW50_06275 [Candidatus Latescibacterota bacterium]|nr:MAG: hypothetical protein JSW50_06275 [Candidatus Latescibacterota bacterium]
MLRTIVFLVGLSALLVGISSYFNGVPIPVDYSSTLITIGVAEFRLDFLLMLIGVPVILFSGQSMKIK